MKHVGVNHRGINTWLDVSLVSKCLGENNENKENVIRYKIILSNVSSDPRKFSMANKFIGYMFLKVFSLSII